MKFKELFSHPWFIAIASICSIAGVIEGVIIFQLQTSHPLVSVSINPIATQVVRAGTASKVTVSFEGKPITTDITAVQIAIWNAGKKSVRAEHILQPLLLSLADKHQILEAQIQRVTREVCGVKLQTEKLSTGELGLSWRILEPNDGALIQVIYEGPVVTPVHAQAIIEEQGQIDKTLSPRQNEITQSGQSSLRILIFVWIVFVVFCGWFAFASFRDAKEASELWRKLVLGALSLGMATAAVWITYSFWLVYASRSPFGF